MFNRINSVGKVEWEYDLKKKKEITLPTVKEHVHIFLKRWVTNCFPQCLTQRKNSIKSCLFIESLLGEICLTYRKRKREREKTCKGVNFH